MIGRYHAIAWVLGAGLVLSVPAIGLSQTAEQKPPPKAEPKAAPAQPPKQDAPAATQPKAPAEPKIPAKTAPTTPEEPLLPTERFGAVTADTVALAPNMIGDQLGPGVSRCVLTRTVVCVPVVLPNGQVVCRKVTVVQERCLQVPSAASASLLKIAENESPMPQARFALDFNFFDNVNETINSRLGGAAENVKLYRGIARIELPIFTDYQSLGLRVPVIGLSADSDVPGLGGSDTSWGDLSLVYKYAPYVDRETGDVFSLGLVFTAPTGPKEFNVFDSFYFQPYVGYILAGGDWFLQGFSSLAVPTQGDEITYLFNDIGLGYFLYRNPNPEGFVSAAVPTLEVHVNTPLNHRGTATFENPNLSYDWVTITGGATFVLCQRSTVALAFGVPVTGPQPYDYEVMVQFNWRF